MLSRVAKPVQPCDPETVSVANALVATMRASKGCTGIAAPQIGAPYRLICVDVTGHRKAHSCNGLLLLANPEITWWTGSVTMREGCLSIPTFTGNVTRPESIVVVAEEVGSGRILIVKADGYEARCILHEIDHLNGIVFLDHIEDPTRDLFERRRKA
jgi:peptide deformylase